MKLSVLPVSLFGDIISGKMPLSEWFDLAEECGLDGLDISMNFIKGHSAVMLRELEEMFRSKKVPVVMCTTYPDFTHKDPEQREREYQYFLNDICICEQLGIPYLRVLAGQAHPDVAVDDGIRWAVENIRRCCEFADRHHVKLLYEDHGKPGAWDYIDMTFPPQYFLRVVEGIRDTSCMVNFDIGNITAAGEDPVPIIEKILPKIETVHVTDMSALGKFDPVLIGTGAAPIRESFRALKAGGYDKWLCIEEASFTGKDGIRKAVEITRKLWEEA